MYMKTKIKILALALAAGLLLPVTMHAQNDGFFRSGGENYSNRDGSGGAYALTNQGFGSDANGGYGLTNQNFGQDAPLGGGLLIMLAAGICYAAVKRDKDRLS